MSLQMESVAHMCRLVSRQVKESFRNLDIHFIVHHEGQRREALAIAAQEIAGHPAAETALHLLSRLRKSEESSVLGTAVAHRRLFFGLASRDSVLSLCTVNLDQFEALQNARRAAWHLAWHAIDAMQFQAAPANRSGRESEIIVRRRNALEMANANMRADAFAAAISTLHGDENAVDRVAIIRGLNSLKTQSFHSPEFFPFVLAKEATDCAVQQAVRHSPSKRQMIPVALKIASNIGRTIDASGLRQWLAFSEPAQDMAWRGFTREEILGAAINTSEDTYVRATGYLIAEITGIRPHSIMSVRDRYSPFADETFNKQLHGKAIQTVFDDVIAQGLQQHSAEPFTRVANMQNELLTEGQTIGWCAAALQAAGRAYQSALDAGSEPVASARREFEGGNKAMGWDTLCDLGKKIVKQCRSGQMVTMSGLEQLCADDKRFNGIRRSVQSTLRDASYQRKMNAAHDLNVNMPRPTAPEPAAPAYAPAAPGLGGSTAHRTKPVPARLPDEEDAVQAT